MGYELAPGTALLATHCAVCSRPLLDADSVTRGIGPICSEKYGYLVGSANSAEANRLVYLIAVYQDGPEVEKHVARIRELGFEKLANIILENRGISLPTLNHNGTEFVLAFPYATATIQALKDGVSYGDRRWNGATKTWLLNRTGAVAALALPQFGNTVVSDAARAALAKTDGTIPATSAATVAQACVIKTATGFCIHTPYNAGAVQALKEAAFGTAHWDRNDKCWSVPAKHAASVAAALAPFFPALAAELANLAPVTTISPNKALTALSTASKADDASEASAVVNGVRKALSAALPANQILYAYQEAGVAFIEAAGGRALVADEMGLGKTVQALGWLAIHPEVTRSIVVCPASLTLNWAREAGKWIPTTKVTVVGSTKATLPTDGLLIISYELATRRAAELTTWNADAVILDEAHYLKNGKAARTKAILGTSVAA